VLNDALLNADVDDNLDVINDDIVRSKIIFIQGSVHATGYSSGTTVWRAKSSRRGTDQCAANFYKKLYIRTL
jgi:hypothetical protein